MNVHVTGNLKNLGNDRTVAEPTDEVEVEDGTQQTSLSYVAIIEMVLVIAGGVVANNRALGVLHKLVTLADAIKVDIPLT